jgi:hypothetical protein
LVGSSSGDELKTKLQMIRSLVVVPYERKLGRSVVACSADPATANWIDFPHFYFHEMNSV